MSRMMNSTIQAGFIVLTVRAILSDIMTIGIGMIITGIVIGTAPIVTMVVGPITIDIIVPGIITVITILFITAVITPMDIHMTIMDMVMDIADIVLIQITGIPTVAKIITTMDIGTVG